jgi:hypothetical protein
MGLYRQPGAAGKMVGCRVDDTASGGAVSKDQVRSVELQVGKERLWWGQCRHRLSVELKGR